MHKNESVNFLSFLIVCVVVIGAFFVIGNSSNSNTAAERAYSKLISKQSKSISAFKKEILDYPMPTFCQSFGNISRSQCLNKKIYSTPIYSSRELTAWQALVGEVKLYDLKRGVHENVVRIHSIESNLLLLHKAQIEYMAVYRMKVSGGRAEQLAKNELVSLETEFLSKARRSLIKSSESWVRQVQVQLDRSDSQHSQSAQWAFSQLGRLTSQMENFKKQSQRSISSKR